MKLRNDMALRVATPFSPLPNPYWVREWEDNPQDNRSLSFISQETKDKIRQIANYLPDINEPWPKENNEPIKGAVLGMVQSGKTAAMVGLISHLFDKGFDAVTVLSGLTNDLNMQTAIRLKNDVFDYGEEVADRDGNFWCTSPKGPDSHKITPISPPQDFYSSPIVVNGQTDWVGWNNARRTLRRNKPCLFVAKKNSGPNMILEKMRDYMIGFSTHCEQHKSRPLRWAIIDDECDQATNARNFNASTPRELREIAEIGQCCYIGFTATPTSNLFIPDEELNPLFPSDFCAVLRSPHHWVLDEGHPSQDLCYHTDSINGMYCGGWVFHNWCDARDGIDTNFFHRPIESWDGRTINLINEDSSENSVGIGFHESLIESFAHYLVSGAARYIFDGRPDFQMSWVPPNTQFPRPHTMLINPRIQKNSHWICAQELINHLLECQNIDRINLSNQYINDTAPEDLAMYVQTCWRDARQGISDFVSQNVNLFQDVYADLVSSFNQVNRVSWDPDFIANQFPSFEDIVTQIDFLSDHIRLKVLNGDTIHRLNFDTRSEGGELMMPEDVYTIAIGGNKLGRGITIDGLCTTLYHTTVGADDRDIQTQRWFGYRGSHIEYIRVFMRDDAWNSASPNHQDGFFEKNENLSRLLQQAADNENNEISPNINHPAWSFSLGPNSNPSNKIVGRHTFGYKNLFINQYVAPASLDTTVAEHNLRIIDELYQTMVNKGMPTCLWQHPTWNGREIGLFCGTPFNGDDGTTGTPNGDQFTALEIADFLDSLQFSNHNPGQDRHPISINSNDLPTHLPDGQFHRASNNNLNHQENTSGDYTDGVIPSASDPYLMAAMLRLWHYGHAEFSVNGESDEIPRISQDCATPPPMFNVLIREGGQSRSRTFSGGEIIHFRGADRLNPNTGQIPNLAWANMNRTELWGSDMRADDIRNNWPIGQDFTRFRRATRSIAQGQPGLLLISIIDDGDNGAPAIFMSVPDGGPSYNYI